MTLTRGVAAVCAAQACAQIGAFGVAALGYAGGFLGPLVLGATLDLLGGASVLGWGVAFGHVTVVLLLGALVFTWLRPADLAGDRAGRASSS